MKSLLILFISILISCKSYSQTFKKDSLLKMTPTERAVFLTTYEKKELLLNELQTKQTLIVNVYFAPKIDAIVKSKENAFSRYLKANALIEARENEYKKIFTQSQFKKYFILKKEIESQLKK